SPCFSRPPAPPPPRSTLFPYTTLFRSVVVRRHERRGREDPVEPFGLVGVQRIARRRHPLELLRERELAIVGARLEVLEGPVGRRSEEHTSELQSRFDLVCRLLLEKKKK